MKLGKKKIILCSLFAGLLSVFAATAATAAEKTEKRIEAKAETTPKYSIEFCYEYKYTYGSGGGTNTTTTTGTDVYSASLQYGNGLYSAISVSLYGSAASGTATLSNGGVIKSRTVNIEFASNFTNGSISVTDSSGATGGCEKREKYHVDGSDGRKIRRKDQFRQLGMDD